MIARKILKLIDFDVSMIKNCTHKNQEISSLTNRKVNLLSTSSTCSADIQYVWLV